MQLKSECSNVIIAVINIADPRQDVAALKNVGELLIAEIRNKFFVKSRDRDFARSERITLRRDAEVTAVMHIFIAMPRSL